MGWDLVTAARQAQMVEEKRMENLLFTRPPNSFMSTSLVKPPTLDIEHGKPP